MNRCYLFQCPGVVFLMDWCRLSMDWCCLSNELVLSFQCTGVILPMNRCNLFQCPGVVFLMDWCYPSNGLVIWYYIAELKFPR